MVHAALGMRACMAGPALSSIGCVLIHGGLMVLGGMGNGVGGGGVGRGDG